MGVLENTTQRDKFQQNLRQKNSSKGENRKTTYRKETTTSTKRKYQRELLQIQTLFHNILDRSGF